MSTEGLIDMDIGVNVGDVLQHHEHGEGVITWINPNPYAKLPIKVHFGQKQFFLMVGKDLKEYPSMQYHKFSSIMRYKRT